MINISYCNDKCPTGIAARDKFLNRIGSAFDAAIDFRYFMEACFKTCPYKSAHCKGKSGA
jgi:hypothetical protein